MDESTRDKFYSPGGDEWGDDEQDYELEPPDAEVIALQKLRAQEDIEASTLAIDVDEIYRDLDGRSDITFSRDSLGKFRFQFQVKHLLILTAVLAVLLTVSQVKLFGAVLGLGALIVAGGSLAYMDIQQQRRWAAAQRRFQEKYERRRKFFERRNRAPTKSSDDAPTIYDDLDFGKATGYAEWAGSATGARRPFRFQFSMWQMFLALTVASFLFGLIYIMGGAQNAASLLGIIAMFGLIVHMFSFDPPEIFVLGWWIVLLLYIVVSIGAAVWTAIGVG